MRIPPQTASSKVSFPRLTKQIATALNAFVDNTPNKPLTIETLDKVQGKFWPSSTHVQEELCQKLWQACEGIVLDYLNRLPLREVQHQGSVCNSKKKPVIFSSREGLDVVIDLKTKGNKLSAVSIAVNPGGSAINVARALNNFGTPFELVGIHGKGPKGDMFSKAMHKEGIDPTNLLKAEMDSRMHFSTVANKNEYWLVSRLPILTGEQLDQLTEQLFDACKRHQKEALALANSEPGGATTDFMPEIARKTQDKFGMFTIYDTKLNAVGRDVVLSILSTSPGIVKPNLPEFSQIVEVNEEILRQDKSLIIHLAQELIKQFGINKILVSLGEEGAMLIDKKKAAFANAPKITVGSPGCAGDAGIAAMIDRSKKQNYPLRNPSDSQFKKLLSAFVAGGAATAAKPGSNLGTLEEAQALEKEVNVRFV